MAHPPPSLGVRYVCFQEMAESAPVTEMVKVFGCRQAYENRPCRNPRDCGDGLWGFWILPIRDDGKAGSAAE
jgi:hypothetical protein